MYCFNYEIDEFEVNVAAKKKERSELYKKLQKPIGVDKGKKAKPTDKSKMQVDRPPPPGAYVPQNSSSTRA
jgi:hypothetical protein